VARSSQITDRSLVKKWKSLTNGRPFLLKGIQCAEDAVKAMECGCDGVVVSNHAGRQVDGAIGSLEALPEVCKLVRWILVEPALTTRSSRVGLCFTSSPDMQRSAIRERSSSIQACGPVPTCSRR
jgi:hypothetical protein